MIGEDERLARAGIVARNAVDRAIATRFSARRFRPDPVPEDLVLHILKIAQRAPSGTNMQPWHAHLVTGQTRARLRDALRDAQAAPADHRQPYAYYPPEFYEPYLSRRRKVGWDLYGLLGIKRGESARMQAQHARNLDFFDAPVGLIFTIDQRLAIGSWLDHGMFLQSVMIAARGHGLHTCPRRPSPPSIARSARSSRSRRPRWSSAAWRWATRTRGRPKTISSPSARRWTISSASTADARGHAGARASGALARNQS